MKRYSSVIIAEISPEEVYRPMGIPNRRYIERKELSQKLFRILRGLVRRRRTIDKKGGGVRGTRRMCASGEIIHQLKAKGQHHLELLVILRRGHDEVMTNEEQVRSV